MSEQTSTVADILAGIPQPENSAAGPEMQKETSLSMVPPSGAPEPTPDPTPEAAPAPVDGGEPAFVLPELSAPPTAPTPPAVNPAAEALGELTTELQELKKGQAEAKAGIEHADAVAAVQAEIQQKYGEVDPEIAQAYPEVIEAAKKIIGAGLEQEFKIADLAKTREIAELKAQVEALQTQVQDIPAVPDPVDLYTSQLQASNPKFAEMVQSPTFAWFIGQSVDPIDPGRTWGHVLNEMLITQDTSRITKLTETFHQKYNTNVRVTAPTSESNAGQVGSGGDYAKARAALVAARKGEIELTHEKRKQLVEFVSREDAKRRRQAASLSP